MELGFEIIPIAEIRAWLDRLVAHGAGTAHRDGPTLAGVASYMAIPVDSLNRLSRGMGNISPERQVFFSKVIALIENGQLTFVRRGKRKVGVMSTNPRPIARYAVHVGSQGARLGYVRRPPRVMQMPAIAALLRPPKPR